jgi:predicted DNA-binding transcriptional regulator AlpA
VNELLTPAEVQLVDTAGIAQFLQLTREYVTRNVTKRPDFPAPRVNRSQKLRRWAREDVEKWASQGA